MLVERRGEVFAVSYAVVHPRKGVGYQAVFDGAARDGQSFEYRNAGGEQCAECSREPRDCRFHHKVAYLRQLQRCGVPHPNSDFRLEENFYEQYYADYYKAGQYVVFLHEIGYVDNHLGQRWHSRVAFEHIRKYFLELRHDEYHKNRDNRHCNTHDYDRINHRALDLISGF